MAPPTSSREPQQSPPLPFHSATPSASPGLANEVDEENPLIAFRRFADEQFAALLHGFVGLPSAFEQRSTASQLVDSEMDRRNEEEQQPGRHRRRGHARRRCTRHVHPELQDAEPVRAADAAVLTQYLLHDAYSPLALETDPALKRIDWRAAFTELVGENSAEDGAARTSADQPPRDWAMATAQRWARDRSHSAGHTGFFIGFPSLHALHAPWDRGLADTMHGMDHGPSLRNAVREKKVAKALQMDDQNANMTNEPQTELDMYERFLDGLRPGDSPRKEREAGTQTLLEMEQPVPAPALVLRAEHPKADIPLPTADHTPNTPMREPGLIATLTTTEQVVLPDGTMHTKVALKKRFSDGREERKESVHTSHGEQHEPEQASELEGDWARIEAPHHHHHHTTHGARDATSPTSVTQALAKEKERKKATGWFWS